MIGRVSDVSPVQGGLAIDCEQAPRHVGEVHPRVVCLKGFAKSDTSIRTHRKESVTFQYEVDKVSTAPMQPNRSCRVL
jgi:hypothetical protein